MVRTTPPPPLDITAVVPELALLGRRAVRLHPRAGTPGRSDSSLGGPLLWPAEEPWPVCDGWLVTERREPIAPEDLQRLRRVHDATHDGGQPVGEETMEEYDERIRIAAGGSIDTVAGDRVFLAPQPHQDPAALVPVLQLYARDIPELPFRGQTDLLQLLWCPNWHDEPWHGPHPVTVWRPAAAVTEPLASPPAPRFDGLFPDLAQREYVPLPCVLHPERIVEYPHSEWPYSSDLPDALAEQVRQWDEQQDGLFSYWNALSTAPGTKVGGHPRWVQGPWWPQCGCGLRMHHLLTIASDEFEIATLGRRWLPLEDRDDPTITGRRLLIDRDCWAPHGIMLGDVGSLYLFTCTGCADRPLAGTMQAW
jgi:hypothetical protein